MFLDCAAHGCRLIGLARYINIFKEYPVRLIIYVTKHVRDKVVKGTKQTGLVGQYVKLEFLFLLSRSALGPT
jgi:hypothetical protein